jgi:uncharacterized protein DUF5758/pentapeptide repeat protein
MKQAELKQILDAHAKWLQDNSKGRRADLSDVDLSCANLSGADLSREDLSDADLSGANLSRANLSGANLSPHSLVPEEGDFVAFKKLAGGKIAKLLIPADAKRISSLVGRKCRASHALVLAITNNGVPDPDGKGVSSHDRTFAYRVGEVARADFNDDIRVECASGIHYFMTLKEAKNYECVKNPNGARSTCYGTLN